MLQDRVLIFRNGRWVEGFAPAGLTGFADVKGYYANVIGYVRVLMCLVAGFTATGGFAWLTAGLLLGCDPARLAGRTGGAPRRPVQHLRIGSGLAGGCGGGGGDVRLAGDCHAWCAAVGRDGHGGGTGELRFRFCNHGDRAVSGSMSPCWIDLSARTASITCCVTVLIRPSGELESTACADAPALANENSAANNGIRNSFFISNLACLKNSATV